MKQCCKNSVFATILQKDFDLISTKIKICASIVFFLDVEDIENDL